MDVLRLARLVLSLRPSAWPTGLSAGTRAVCASFASASHQQVTSGQAARIDSKDLSAASAGSYYSLSQTLLPEAGHQYAGAFYTPREAGHERRGGCKALQQEVAATRCHAIMYRPLMHTLFSAVGGDKSQAHHQRLLLTGPPGAGKSIALVALVEWARQQGWLVLYVPSCAALVQGGYFARRGSSRRWDTLTSAQQLLKGILDAHGPRLKELPLLKLRKASSQPQLQQQMQTGRYAAGQVAAAAVPVAPPAEVESAGATGPAAGPAGEDVEEDVAALWEDPQGRSLHDLVASGLTRDDDAKLAVDTVLALVRQLAAAASLTQAGKPSAPPVLFVLDDYNYLYGATDYGWYSPDEDPRKARRRPILTNDLVLASGLRLLDAPTLGGATVVAATTTALSLPAPATLPPLRMPYEELPVTGFCEAEVRNALAHYHATGYASCLATSRQARELYALTQGNARELRISASTLGLKLS